MTIVRSIQTNLKGAEEPVELAPCVMLVGANGTGKSTIVDSLSLVLTGSMRTPGLGKREADLFRLVSGEGDRELIVTARLGDDRAVTWKTQGSEVSAKKATWTVTEGETPLGVFVSDTAEAFLLGDEKKIRRAVLLAAGGGVPRVDLLAEVPASQHDIVVEVLPGDDKEIAFETLLGARDSLMKKARDARAGAKAVEKTAEVAALSENERKLFVALCALDGEHPGVVQRTDQATVSYQESLHTIYHGASRASYELGALLSAKGVTQVPKCPMCGTADVAVTQISERSEELISAAEKVSRWLDEVEGKNAAAWARDEVAALLPNESIGNWPEIYRGLLARNRAQSTAHAAARVATDANRGADDYKAVGLAFDGLMGKFLERSTAVIERRINRLLPRSVRARIVLAEGTKAVCRLAASKGTDTPYRDFRALSGAERQVLSIAFAAATVPVDAPPVRLLVIDDVWLDNPTMKKVLATAANAVTSDDSRITQAVVCAVSWTAKVPDGWQVIKLP